MTEQTLVFWILGGLVLLLLGVGIFGAVLVYRLIKYQSDRILANSLGEAKILEQAKDTDGFMISGFPETDDVLAKREDNARKAKLIQLKKAGRDLDKEMDKIVKKYG